jgi:nucleotide-binding universal stress UspA family protein
MRPSNAPGDELLSRAEAEAANYIVVGHRGMSAVKRYTKDMSYDACNTSLD